MMRLSIGLFLLACGGSTPQQAEVEAPVAVVPAPEPPTTSKPKLKLPPAGHVPYSNPAVMNHEGGKKASGDSITGRSRTRGPNGEEANEWSWPKNATKPNAPNAPRYDDNGRRVYRASELIDNDELSRRLQQRGQ
jgi:hypothetical protein